MCLTDQWMSVHLDRRMDRRLDRLNDLSGCPRPSCVLSQPTCVRPQRHNSWTWTFLSNLAPFEICSCLLACAWIGTFHTAARHTHPRAQLKNVTATSALHIEHCDYESGLRGEAASAVHPTWASDIRVLQALSAPCCHVLLPGASSCGCARQPKLLRDRMRCCLHVSSVHGHAPERWLGPSVHHPRHLHLLRLWAQAPAGGDVIRYVVARWWGEHQTHD